jgi:hypothetical protein
VSDGLAVAEEFVVLVVAAVAAADVVEVGDELDTLDPFDEFEAELDLVAQPQGAPCPNDSGLSFMS